MSYFQREMTESGISKHAESQLGVWARFGVVAAVSTCVATALAVLGIIPM